MIRNLPTRRNSANHQANLRRWMTVILASCLLTVSCTASAEVAEDSLQEPSGMSVSSTPGQFWLVSDAGPDIALVDETGATIKTISIDLPDTDWEGIVELENGNLLVAEERRYELIEIDPHIGTIVAINALSEMDGFDAIASLITQSSENKGLEGITVDGTGDIWVVKESEPALLIQVDADRTSIKSWIDPSPALANHLGVGAKKIDLSGLAPHTDSEKLWILSHKASTAFIWNTVTSTIDESHALDLDKAEGIAAHPDGVLIVDENSGRLVVIDVP